MFYDGSDLIMGRQPCKKHRITEMQERERASGRAETMIDFDLLKNAFIHGTFGIDTVSGFEGALGRDTLKSAKSGSRGFGKLGLAAKGNISNGQTLFEAEFLEGNTSRGLQINSVEGPDTDELSGSNPKPNSGKAFNTSSAARFIDKKFIKQSSTLGVVKPNLTHASTSNPFQKRLTFANNSGPPVKQKSDYPFQTANDSQIFLGDTRKIREVTPPDRPLRRATEIGNFLRMVLDCKLDEDQTDSLCCNLKDSKNHDRKSDSLYKCDKKIVKTSPRGTLYASTARNDVRGSVNSRLFKEQ
jgi:hypothetical protein